ncbi:MAG: imidazolonepropionase, partial [Bacteroidales bacterium]
MAILIKNIKKLVQVEDEIIPVKRGTQMATLKCIDNAFLLIEGGFISNYGHMSQLMSDEKKYETIDASGKMVFPSYCDSHTHIVYAGSREKEFVDKIRGFSYQEIAKRGGGILNSARHLHETSQEK